MIDLSKVDYHIHTCFSDGALTPEEVVDRWQGEGYKQIAITDHDGLGGARRAAVYALDRGITVIPGIEISTRDNLNNTIHVLGYGIDMNNEVLVKAVDTMDEWRALRNDKLMDAMIAKGYDITVEEVLAVNHGRYVGKPTFAKVLVDKGYATSIDEVFGTIFAEEEIRKLKKQAYNTKTAIDIIHEAGGVAVFAHPMELKRRSESIDEFMPRLYQVLDKMLGWGIDGIECFHPSAAKDQSEMLMEYAMARGLVVTKGSDFHSDNGRNYEG